MDLQGSNSPSPLLQSPRDSRLKRDLLGSQECWKFAFPEGKFAGERGAHGDWQGRWDQAAPELGRGHPSPSPGKGRSPRDAVRHSGPDARRWEASLSGPRGAGAPLKRRESGHS